MRIELYDGETLLGYAELPVFSGLCLCNGQLFEGLSVHSNRYAKADVPVVTLLAADGTPLPRIHYTGGNEPGHDSQDRPLDAQPNDFSNLEPPLLPEKTLTQLEDEERIRKRQADGR